MAVTIKQVAHEARVSIATVSRVFNQRALVHDETRRRILEVAARLRYVPHGAARSLITHRTHTVCALLPDIFGEFFSELIRGLDRAARTSGYHLLVSGSHADRAEVEAVVGTMRGRVDGVIAMSPDINPAELQRHLPEELPFIVIGPHGEGGAFDAVGIDNRLAAYEMLRHLFQQGHRRIAFIKGPVGNHEASERLRGYREAVRALRAEADPELELEGDFTDDAGHRAGLQIVARPHRPTAVFAANDAMAIGLLSALNDAGVRVPQEIAVAGFDDIPIARFTQPPLTTIHVPAEEIGACAMERLLDAIERGTQHARRQQILPTELVVRSSCGAGPGRAGAATVRYPGAARRGRKGPRGAR